MNNPDDVYDEWLVLRCQGGDSGAMSLLVRRWHPRLLSFATRLMGDAGSAEDIIQSSWVEIVKRIGTLKDPRSIRPWLFRIVANKCADSIRRNVSRRKMESSVNPDQIADPTVDRLVREANDRDRRQKLRVAIEHLDDDAQRLIQLYYVNGLPVRSIADQLALPLGTVKSRLHHVRVKLKEILKGNE